MGISEARHGPGDEAAGQASGAVEQSEFVEELHNMGAVLWEMDAQTWRFTYVSQRAEQVFGYPVAEWTKDGFWQDILVHPEDRDWCVNFCGVATGECADHAFLYRAKRADGEIIWIKDVVRVISEDGKAVALRGLMVEVTEEMATRPEVKGRALDFSHPEVGDLRRLLAG